MSRLLTYGIGETVILSELAVADLYDFCLDDRDARQFYHLSMRHQTPVEALILKVKTDNEGNNIYLVDLTNEHGRDELWVDELDLQPDFIGEA